jgi:hypothetical protein
MWALGTYCLIRMLSSIARHLVHYLHITILDRSPILNHSDIGLKGSPSDIISDIIITFLATCAIQYLKNLHTFLVSKLNILPHTLVARVRILPVYYSEYRILD